MVASPRNQLETHEAGTQDSGLFFCASYENWVVVFLASPEMSAGFRTRRSSPGSGLQLLPSTDSQRLMGCVQNSFPCFRKEVEFLRKVSGHENDELGKSAFMHAVLQSATLLNEVPQD
jgi:hypothetical protein